MKDNSEKHLIFASLSLFVLLGGWLRFAPTILSGHVINDGGMFYSMVQAIIENNFQLPLTITYNGLNIPFAYPPFPFYLLASLTESFDLPLIGLFRWLPPLFSTLSIFAFFLTARTVLKSTDPALLATAGFAFLPRAYTWFVMGGGISRAMGQVFLLFAVWSAYKAFTSKQFRYSFICAAFSALVAVSHPGQLLHTLILCVYLWLSLDRKAFIRALGIAFGTALLSAPWWVTIFSRYGMAPILSAAQTGGASVDFWLAFITPTFAEEAILSVFTIFAILGLVVKIIHREYLLIGMLVLPFLFDPRTAPAIAIIPLAMLAGVGLNDLVLPAVARLSEQKEPEKETGFESGWLKLFIDYRPVRWVLGYFLFISLLGGFAYDQPLARTTLPDSSKNAMLWISEKTPPDSSFIVLTGVGDPFGDPVQEWFPVFTHRVSFTTIQGREWLLGKNFFSYVKELAKLQECLNDDPECLFQFEFSEKKSVNYLYLLKTRLTSPEINSRNPGLMSYHLRTSSDYDLVYENQDVEIFYVLNSR